MAKVGLEVTVDGKIVKQGLQDLSKDIPRIGRQQLYKTLVAARKRLRKKAPKPGYPIAWDSPKQKVKVIIMLKAAGNLPYRRKGDYNKGFEVVQTKTGYQLINSVEKASFIGGDAEGQGQSRIFQGRYPVIRQVLDEEMEKLPDAVVQYIMLSAAEKGFKSTKE